MANINFAITPMENTATKVIPLFIICLFQSIIDKIRI